MWTPTCEVQGLLEAPPTFGSLGGRVGLHWSYWKTPPTNHRGTSGTPNTLWRKGLEGVSVAHCIRLRTEADGTADRPFTLARGRGYTVRECMSGVT